MIRVCCVCNRVMSPTGDPREIWDREGVATHGYCNPCYKTAIADIRAYSTMRQAKLVKSKFQAQPEE